MRAKIGKIRRGEREPTQNRVLGAGHQPTQANTGGRKGTSAKPAGPDEEDTAIIHGGGTSRSTAVVFRGRLWQTGQEIGISVGDARAVLESVAERGDETQCDFTRRFVLTTTPIVRLRGCATPGIPARFAC